MGNCARDTLFEHAIVTTKPPSSLLWRLHCKVYNRSYYRVLSSIIYQYWYLKILYTRLIQ